ncbi:Pho80p cyclin [Malassezia sp. CBS 17886]|nr:Pho80p cyclin [Malassezia sp. CBS 17886]
MSSDAPAPAAANGGGTVQKWSPSALISECSSESRSLPSSEGLSGENDAARNFAKSAASREEAQQRELPARFYEADPDDLLSLIAEMLTQLMAHNDLIPLQPSDLTRFHSRATPSISVDAYLRRMAKYTTLDKPCMLVLLVYIDRVCERMSGFTLCSLTVHRFVCAAVVCASKALCDSFSTNMHYARVGGISLVELNMLEKEFLNCIDWRLIVTAPVMQHYYTSLAQMHPNYKLAPATTPLPTAFPKMSHWADDDETSQGVAKSNRLL